LGNKLDDGFHPECHECDNLLSGLYHLIGGTHGDFLEFFEYELAPTLTKPGGSILATFVTENHPNTFPSLPVRTGVNVFVSFSRFANREAYEQHALSVAEPTSGKQSALIKTLKTLLLAPTARSLLA
jgi:hypothetical protein